MSHAHIVLETAQTPAAVNHFLGGERGSAVVFIPGFGASEHVEPTGSMKGDSIGSCKLLEPPEIKNMRGGIFTGESKEIQTLEKKNTQQSR